MMATIMFIIILMGSEKGEVLLRGVGTLRYSCRSSAKTLPGKSPSVQWQPGSLTIHTKIGS